MKKKFFLVAALVVMSMTAMFVSCKKNGSIENGCTCTMKDYSTGETETEFITAKEMKEVAAELVEMGITITSCSDYSNFVMKSFGDEAEGSIKCK